MTRAEMVDLVSRGGPDEAMRSRLLAEDVVACSSSRIYQEFRRAVSGEFPKATHVSIAGSGNWGFSLNPEKNFRTFGEHSDIDVALIDESTFYATWDIIRQYHREFYYKIDFDQRLKLRRNGENIYSGFVSPAWIPERRHSARIAFARVLSRLSTEHIGFKQVKILVFRNLEETLDYYKRGLYLLNRK